MGFPVFYTPLAVCDSPITPSALKPQQVVNDWEQAFGDAITIHQHGAISSIELELAHSEHYIKSILNGTRANGLGIKGKRAIQSLAYTTGGLMAAADYVTTGFPEDAYPAACAPYSGFHHAHPDRPSGFCTFNGLVVTALAQIKKEQADEVLILDCDYHYGDGTQAILDSVDDDDTGFIHHWSAGKFYSTPKDALRFFDELEDNLKPFKNADLVLYQAGADQHRHDPLGGMFTTKQMQLRDRLIFSILGQWGTRVVWNLAGGYQTPFTKVLTLHRNTMKEAIGILTA